MNGAEVKGDHAFGPRDQREKQRKKYRIVLRFVLQMKVLRRESKADKTTNCVISQYSGGAGSLALTFLCPNSLLTGNLTGNLANSGALKPHFLSLSCTFQKETSVQA